jgi:phosphoglycolate phosphatase-like HAD superfamily hydrolase
VTRIEGPRSIFAARSTPPDGAAFIKAQLNDIKARVAKGERVRVVFDIDDTLADTRPRTVAIAKAWDAQNGTHYFDGLKPGQVPRSPRDLAEGIGVPFHLIGDFTNFWSQAFWDGANFKHDAPMKQTIDIAKAARAAGAELVFLTGRLQASAKNTVEQLKGFGLAGTLVAKPQRWMRTAEFKTAWFQRSDVLVSFFVTESRRDIGAVQRGAGVPSVLLSAERDFNGAEPIRPDTPVLSP